MIGPGGTIRYALGKSCAEGTLMHPRLGLVRSVDVVDAELRLVGASACRDPIRGRRTVASGD
jgi:hypothetical protein